MAFCHSNRNVNKTGRPPRFVADLVGARSQVLGPPLIVATSVLDSSIHLPFSHPYIAFCFLQTDFYFLVFIYFAAVLGTKDARQFRFLKVMLNQCQGSQRTNMSPFLLKRKMLVTLTPLPPPCPTATAECYNILFPSLHLCLLSPASYGQS